MTSILGFGDSLTAGSPGYDPAYDYGDERSQYGFWLLEESRKTGYHDISFTNRGVLGELAEWMPDRLLVELRDAFYDFVIIMGGSNDIGWGRPIDSIKNSLNKMWKIALDNSHQVIACTIPPIGSFYPDIQTAQNSINIYILNNNFTSNTLFTAVDTFASLSNQNGLLQRAYDSGDGLHLSIEGYKKLGEAIWNSGVRSLLNPH